MARTKAKIGSSKNKAPQVGYGSRLLRSAGSRFKKKMKSMIKKDLRG